VVTLGRFSKSGVLPIESRPGGQRRLSLRAV